MSTGYQIKNQNGLYFLTFQVVNWVDVFSREVYGYIRHYSCLSRFPKVHVMSLPAKTL